MGPKMVEGNHVVSVESRAYTMGPVAHHHGDVIHEPTAGTRVIGDTIPISTTSYDQEKGPPQGRRTSSLFYSLSLRKESNVRSDP
jgi:hypothetical protein